VLFNSLHFGVFFVIVTALFFAFPHRLRGVLLLIASVYFYMAFIPVYILILVATILVDYAAGFLIDRSQGQTRKWWLIVSIAANVGVLAFFKYFNFANDTLRTLAGLADWRYPVPVLDIILPIGLSFHTFQSMAYTIEVYRGRQQVERNLWRFALYVLFYPQLVAGPIERPQNLLRQLHVEQVFDYERAKLGLQLMAWGFFKKVVIADRLAAVVNTVYQQPDAYSGSASLVATYLFAIQIYCDFSGYSDIAIGAAQVMGFTLMKNFDRPYFSQSISEFWRRWHISLSTWFRDYVYVPLGGSRVSQGRRALNLLLVFSLSGLWHGANWTYVIWGALNGVYLVFGLFTLSFRQRLTTVSRLERIPSLHRLIRTVVTFHLVLLAWVFFRATSLEDAGAILRSIATWGDGASAPLEIAGGRTLIVPSIALLVTVEYMQARYPLRDVLARQHVLVRWPTYVTALTGLLLLGEFASQQQFIYFQF
jgi:alginate O-acetyltransferase complex protein AlgI